MSARLLKIKSWEILVRAAKFRAGVMAAMCPVSTRQLERFFLQHFNQTPKAYAKAQQLIVARQLISQGMSNKAVAYEIGLSQSQLCCDFKKFYGESPQSFGPEPRLKS